MNRFIAIFISLVCAIDWQSVSAQSYFAGKIYFKLRNSISYTLPAAASREAMQEARLRPEAGVQQLFSLADAYGFTSVQRSFRTRSTELDRTYTLYFSDTARADALIAAMAQIEDIEYAEKARIYHTSFVPNDYVAQNQWYLAAIKAAGAWDVSKGSSNVHIAIVDCGVDMDHSDLMGNLWTNPFEIPDNNVDDDLNGFVDDMQGWDAADNDNNPDVPITALSHGTHVAGCASPVTNNSKGVSGIGYSCQIIAVKATGNTGSPTSISAGYEGIDYAIAARADVINLSWGGGGGASPTEQNIINAAYNQNIVVVAAAGNDNVESIFYPAGYNHVITVGASNSQNQRASFSNYGTWIDVMAPGANIYSTYPFSTYQTESGTSMASPIVAGLCGLMLSANPCLTPDDVEAILKQTCTNINAQNNGFLGKIGAGLINAQAALQMVQVNAAPTPAFSYNEVAPCSNKIAFAYSFTAGNFHTCPTEVDWKFMSADGTFSTTDNTQLPVIEFPKSGTYTVILKAKNNYGTAIDTQTIVLGAAGGAYAGTDTTICAGRNITLKGTTGVLNPATLRWQADSTIVGSAMNTVVAPTKNQVYTFYVTDAAGNTACDQIAISVKPVPNMQIAIPKTKTVTIAAGASTQLMVAGATSYTWYPATGLNKTTGFNPMASPAVTTMYYVEGGNSTSACTKLDSILVVVQSTSIGETLESPMGSISAPQPNPAREQVLVSAQFAQAGALSIRLYDLTGREHATLFVETVGAGAFSQTLSLTQIPAGMWLLQWQKEGITHYQRIVIE